ncbi:hypothetical protein L1049_011985 [Liquidambar formosana]|uniref:Uncharacterized protein n=1 Tax=Liquidambar formosana TaxID=63359 RepID=A0AAP0X3J7_LIQFO
MKGGEFMAGLAKHIPYVENTQMVEALAVREGLKFGIEMSFKEAFWKWLFVISNLSFEILASAFDQVSSPNKPGYALAGLVMSLVAVAVCVTEFLWKARMEKVTMRRWGPVWCFYYRSPRGRLYGTFAEIFGLSCAILQVLFSAIQYDFFHQHADNPIKISIFPIIFALCVSGSKLINNPNERPLESHSVVDHRETELEEIAVQR